MKGYSIKLGGQADFSRGIEIILKNFKQFIQRELTNVMAWRVARSVEVELNKFLSSGGQFVDLSQNQNNDSGNYLNMTLL